MPKEKLAPRSTPSSELNLAQPSEKLTPSSAVEASSPDHCGYESEPLPDGTARACTLGAYRYILVEPNAKNDRQVKFDVADILHDKDWRISYLEAELAKTKKTLAKLCKEHDQPGHDIKTPVPTMFGKVFAAHHFTIAKENMRLLAPKIFKPVLMLVFHFLIWLSVACMEDYFYLHVHGLPRTPFFDKTFQALCIASVLPILRTTEFGAQAVAAKFIASLNAERLDH